jgi:hypothetical protein
MRARVRRKSKGKAQKSAAVAGSRRQKLLIYIGVLIPLVLLAISLARGASETWSVPAYLLGVWESPQADYADSYMEITPATIEFDNVEGGYSLYFVTSSEQIRDGGQSYDIVHYRDLEGAEYQMSICYQPRPQESLYFKNQPKVVWKRRGDS